MITGPSNSIASSLKLLVRVFVLLTLNFAIFEVSLRAVNAFYPLERPEALRDTYKSILLKGEDWFDGIKRFYLLRPNSRGLTYGHETRINRWGFRGRDFLERDIVGDDVFRVMVLGDSLTMGMGIAEESRYTNQLEVMLREQFPLTKIEVINLGIHGYSTVQHASVANLLTHIIRPDLTIVGFYWNDPRVSYENPRPFRILSNGILRSNLEKLLSFRLIETLYDRTYRKLYGMPDTWGEIDRAYDVDSDDWRVFEKSVAEMSAPINRYNNGRKPLAVLLRHPDDFGIDFKYLNSDKVRSVFEKNGFEVIESEKGNYFPVSKFEGHPNEETNRYYAGLIFSKMNELQIVQAWNKVIQDRIIQGKPKKQNNELRARNGYSLGDFQYINYLASSGVISSYDSSGIDITNSKYTALVGFAEIGGPAPKWGIPNKIRWMNAPTAHIPFELEGEAASQKNEYSLSIRLRNSLDGQELNIYLNGERISQFLLDSSKNWVELKCDNVVLKEGLNLISFEASKFSGENQRKMFLLFEEVALEKNAHSNSEEQLKCAQ